jgi:ABC-2 type transport system permease protein
VLFLGLGALLVSMVPRLGVGAAYALVVLAFVWELFGALVGIPSWLLAVSPFHQIGLVPAAPFRATAAIGMLVLGAAGAAAAVVRFRDRDLSGL